MHFKQAQLGLKRVSMEQKFLAKDQFQQLLNALQSEGYSLLGPREKQGAIVYEQFSEVEQLPQGMIDVQQPGRYELKQGETNRLFAWSTAAQSVKPLTFAPTEKLWHSEKTDGNPLSFTETLPKVKPTAVIGVRACDLAALELQDRHFLQKEYVDPYYEQRRSSLFLVAVNCSHPAETCFCHSTNDGPVAKKGYDIVLTELEDGFLIAAGSVGGQVIIDSLSLDNANVEQLQSQTEQEKVAISKQVRQLPSCDVAAVLKDRQEHAQWDDIGQRCLSCGNCTAVCPSCFCHSEHDSAPLGSPIVDHVRQWDSCFNHEHSYIHGIVIRKESKTRYRQWMTHKFSSWLEQYGRSGCTGCGRCISWCPVGIDVTQELALICGETDE